MRQRFMGHMLAILAAVGLLLAACGGEEPSAGDVATGDEPLAGEATGDGEETASEAAGGEEPAVHQGLATLAEQGGSGVSGAATLSWDPATDVLSVTVEVDGLEEGASYVSVIAPACQPPMKRIHALDGLVGGADGTARATTEVTDVESMDLDGGWMVLVARPQRGPQSCGTVGPVDGQASRLDGTVRVAVPHENLQFMAFWATIGAGFFEDEGLEVEAVTPRNPREAPELLLDGEAEVAVLPPPMYLPLIGEGEPVLVFANLLRNDGLNIVVSREVAAERDLTADMALADRLEGMRGLRIGLGPVPTAWLRSLFASVGMDADRDVEMVIVHGEEQDAAFAEGRVDALYAHTPHLERSLVGRGAVLIVNQSAGEVPMMANRVIHALVTTKDYADANPEVVAALTRAVHRAQDLIHSDPRATGDALRRSGLEGSEPDELEAIIAVYGPAVPETPEVSVEGVRRSLELLPPELEPPDLSDEDLAAHIDGTFAQEAVSDSR